MGTELSQNDLLRGLQGCDELLISSFHREPEENLFAVPNGFTLQEKPLALDASLVNMYILFKWAAGQATRKDPNPDAGGWYLGKLTRCFDPSTPSLFKKFNYDVAYADGKRGQMLKLDDFMGAGDDLDKEEYSSVAPPGSWTLLTMDGA